MTVSMVNSGYNIETKGRTAHGGVGRPIKQAALVYSSQIWRGVKVIKGSVVPLNREIRVLLWKSLILLIGVVPVPYKQPLARTIAKMGTPVPIFAMVRTPLLSLV